MRELRLETLVDGFFLLGVEAGESMAWSENGFENAGCGCGCCSSVFSGEQVFLAGGV